MSRYDYSKVEQQINNVLAYQDQELKAIKPLDRDALDVRITESEDLLRSLGYQLPSNNIGTCPAKARYCRSVMGEALP